MPSPKEILTYADSAASDHCFVDAKDFTEYKPVERKGATASGEDFAIAGVGTVRKSVMVDGRWVTLSFSDALHTPDLAHNLISIGCLDRRGCSVSFGGGKAIFVDPKGAKFMVGSAVGTMYQIELQPTPPTAFATPRSLTRPADLETWHRRLGHVSEDAIKRMQSDQMVLGLDITSTSVNGKCEDCIFGKQSRRPFDAEITPETKVLERVHVDLWGPASKQSPSGKLYMMLIIDGGSSYIDIHFLSNKEMATTLDCFSRFHAMAERQTGQKLKCVRTDNGSEFVNSAWSGYLTPLGIAHEQIASYSSATNGVPERGNRTILDRVRSMLHDASLPGTYWAEAASTAVYLKNRQPTSRHPGKTPYELWSGEKPDVSYLRPFGCLAYAKIPDSINDGKLAPRSVKCVLLGYFGIGVYRVLDRSSGRIFKSRDVIFEEGKPKRTLYQTLGSKPPLYFPWSTHHPFLPHHSLLLIYCLLLSLRLLFNLLHLFILWWLGLVARLGLLNFLQRSILLAAMPTIGFLKTIGRRVQG